VRVVRKEYAALASEKQWNIYGLDASIAAVIGRLSAALAMYQEAVDEEDAEVQSILKGDTFCINWVSGKGKAHCIAVGKMLQTITGWIESYDELDMNDFSAVSAWVAKVYKAGENKAIFETKSEGFASFKMLLRGCSGPSFMPRMLPGCLHLFLRTVERVVAAEGVYKHVISNSKYAAIDAARAAGVEVEFGYDTYQTEALVCRLVGGACGDWAANLSRHFDEVAKLYGEHDKHELELLVRAAYLLPYMLYKIAVDHDPEKTFCKSHSELSDIIEDLGFASRVAFIALFDDYVVHIPSVCHTHDTRH
jgi:hypothetical protein